MSSEEIVWVCVIGAFGWTLLGETILGEYENSSVVYKGSCNFRPYINPVWLYKHYSVNFFGAFLLTILFNLISPFVSAFYWIGMLVKMIATVGRNR